MNKKIYHLDLEGSINYSLSFTDSRVELSIYFRHGKPENIIYQYNDKKFYNYEGYEESKRKFRRVSNSELRTEFLGALELFLESTDKVKYGSEVAEAQDITNKLNKLIEHIK